MKNLIKSINKKTFAYIFLLVSVLLGAYCFFGQHLFISSERFGIVFMSIMFGLLLAVFIASLFYYRRYLELKINVVALALMGFILLVQTPIIFLTPDSFTVSVHGVIGEVVSANITIDTAYRFFSLFNFTSLLIVAYNLLFIVPHLISPDSIVMKLVLIGTIAFVIGGAIYSLIAEFNTYGLFIENIKSLYQECFTKSFFPHKNNWGLFLMVGSYSAIYLYFIYRKKWLMVLPAVFYILMVFSMCKTTLIIQAVMMLAFIVYLLVVTYKNNPKRNRIVIYCLSGLILTGLIIIFVTPLRDTFFSMIGSGSDSGSSRMAIWSKTFEFTSTPIKVFFGNGFGITAKILYELNYNDPYSTANWGTYKTHNMYIQTFADGGILLFLVFVLCLVFVVYKMVVYWKKNNNYSFVMLLGVTILFSIWFFES